MQAVRTPIGRRNGSLSNVSSPRLLSAVQVAVLDRAGLDAGEVDQLVGGCVTQAGMQAINVTRMAWLTSGTDFTAAATTIDCQCGSGLQANTMMAGLIATGGARIGIACGVEHMSGVPLRTALEAHPTKPRDAEWPWTGEAATQFEGAERIAARHGFGRADLDQFGVRSQALAKAAWDAGRFTAETVPIEFSKDGRPSTLDRDEGLRDTDAASLARLNPIIEGGLHTAGTASQISDGAAALLWLDEEVAKARSLRPRALIAYHTMVGCDPYYYLDGPVEATRKMLSQSGFTIADFDVVECNEAFASVPLAFQRSFDVPDEKLNPNGGAIATGHPVGASGARLLVSTINELERIDGELGYITMCQGGSLGIAVVVQRLC